MSKSNSFETDLLELIFTNVDIANIGDGTGLRGSTTPGSLYVSLHTADPGEAGAQNTNECAYTSYAREAVARSGAGWTVSGNTVDNAAAITFTQATGGSETATYFGIGSGASGATQLLYSGLLNSSLAISSGVQPEFAIGDLNVTED